MLFYKVEGLFISIGVPCINSMSLMPFLESNDLNKSCSDYQIVWFIFILVTNEFT